MKQLFLYLLEQSINTRMDTFDSVVVAAENVDEAKTIHPANGYNHPEAGTGDFNYDWADRKHIKCTKIGIASNGVVKGKILASYNAG